MQGVWDSVPGVERMPTLDEDELFVWLVSEHRDYAFEWDGGRKEEFRKEAERYVRGPGGERDVLLRQ